MAAPENVKERYLEIESRTMTVINLLRARNFVMGMRNEYLSAETVNRMGDTNVALFQLQNFTENIVILEKDDTLSEDDKYRRGSLIFYWNTLAKYIIRDVELLETESNLVKSRKAPEPKSVFRILHDLKKATVMYRMQYDLKRATVIYRIYCAISDTINRK